MRLKKLGIVRKKYDPNAQSWLMRLNGKVGRKYRGGVAANTTFYLFSHGKDGAFPISDWYNFTTIQRYKTLDADDAEERYAQRGKILNKWAVMVNKKLKPEDEGGKGVEEEEEKEKHGYKGDFKDGSLQNWLQVLCNGGMALGLSLLYLLDLSSADLPVVFRWVSDIQTFCSAAVSPSAGTTTAVAAWAWRCPAVMATPGPASSAPCSPRQG